ncbi:hypothetical protein HWN76_27435, partial [Escherichia coli]|nr:hypothetical protein [Escherichia coli]
MGSLDRRGTRACSGFTSLGTIALLGVLAATPAWAQDAAADSAAPAIAEP